MKLHELLDDTVDLQAELSCGRYDDGAQAVARFEGSFVQQFGGGYEERECFPTSCLCSTEHVTSL